MLYLILSWRNIWRSKRRTLITMSSVIMAVLLVSVMSSMQQGQYDQMIENTVGSNTGHLQIHAQGYWEEPTLNNSFVIDSTLLNNLEKHPGVASVVPRLDSYTLAAGTNRSRAALVMGIDIEAEKKLSAPDEKVVRGTYFKSMEDSSALVAAGVADYLNVTVGDTLVLLGQGFRGMSAAGAYPIRGILEFGIREVNNSLIYLPLPVASEFFATGDRLTALALLVHNPEEVFSLTNELRQELPNDYEVMPWQELSPELVQAIQADYGSSLIIQLILYMVVGFGIFGTVLMMTAERRYELGVLIAIGTSRSRIAFILWLEMAFITLAGTLLGILGSIPFIYYFHIFPLQFSGTAAEAIEEFGMEPFIRFSIDPSIFLTQGTIILVITLLIGLYPLWYASKLQPVNAMRN